jgi:large subunit ribosomal protein L23
MNATANIKKIIVKPLISERSLSMIDTFNKYSFIINTSVSKVELANYIEKTFSVSVLDVRTINVNGKLVRFGKKRTPGRRKSYKKAIITLKKGDKINLFDIK